MAPAIQIRLAVLAERAQLIELQRRASLENPADRKALLANPDAITLPSNQIVAGRVFVAVDDILAIGFAAVLRRDDGNSELDALFVEPAYWRMGVGRALVDHCSRFARLDGSNVLHVIGNPHAETFYNNCKFRQTGINATRFGTSLLMERRLQASNGG